MVDRAVLLSKLTEFVEVELLDGQEKGIEPTTPLLEWGLIDSFSMVRLISFIHKSFGVEIPPDQLRADTFQNLSVLTDRLMEKLG
jgi:acyl carrier protein